MPTSKERRSKSCGRQLERELRSTGANSQGMPLAQRTGRSSRSPARRGILPLEEVNKEATEVNNEDPKNVSQIISSTMSSRAASGEGINGSTNIPSIEQNKFTAKEISEGGTTAGVSDNRGSSINEPIDTSDTPSTTDEDRDQIKRAKEDPGGAIVLVLQELQEIRKQMITLNKLESNTASIAEQLAATTNRTTVLESKINTTEAGVISLRENLSTLESGMAQHKGKQEEIETRVKELDGDYAPLKAQVKQHEGKINKLQNLKKELEDFSESSEKNSHKMNELIETQRNQVDSFNGGAKQLEQKWKLDVMAEVEKRFNKMENEKHCNELRAQAYKNRYNLVVLGLQEEREKSTMQVLKVFFKDTLQTQHLDIHSAERLGTQTEDSNSYARPIVVRFNKLPHRNKIWRKRKLIPNEGPHSKVRIHADLPKELREGIQTLYRVATAASKMESFEGIKIQDYQLVVNGETYQITDLEMLPQQIRPSTIASPQSDTHLVFFSKHTIFSNHYPSPFTIEGQQYGSMEHFLAVKRAELSGKEDIIYRATNVKDPIQAKHILNILHNDQQEQWEARIEELVMEGLRAKFLQNPQLRDHLINTGNLILGEASTNPKWGIGMDLTLSLRQV